MKKRIYGIALLSIALLLLLQGCALLEGILGSGSSEAKVLEQPKHQEQLLVYHQSGWLELLTLTEGAERVERKELLQIAHPVAWQANETRRELVILQGKEREGRRLLYLQLALPSTRRKHAGTQEQEPPRLRVVNDIAAPFPYGEGHLAFSQDKVILSSVAEHSIVLSLIRKGKLQEADWYIDIAQSSPSEIVDVSFAPSGQDLYVTDKGQRKSFHFRVNETMPPLTIDNQNIELQEGEVPLDFVISEQAKHGYMLLEGGVIQHYRRAASKLVPQGRPRATFPGCQRLILSPKGDCLYAFREGDKRLVVWYLNKADGTLQQGGEQLMAHPLKNIYPSPSSQWVAVQYEGLGGLQLYRQREATTQQSGQWLLQKRKMPLDVKHPFGVIWLGKRTM